MGFENLSQLPMGADTAFSDIQIDAPPQVSGSPMLQDAMSQGQPQGQPQMPPWMQSAQRPMSGEEQGMTRQMNQSLQSGQPPQQQGGLGLMGWLGMADAVGRLGSTVLNTAMSFRKPKKQRRGGNSIAGAFR